MVCGRILTVVLIILSPTVQIDILKHHAAWFPLKNPGLITIPVSFVIGIVASLLRPEPSAREAYAAVEERIHLGAVQEPFRQ